MIRTVLIFLLFLLLARAVWRLLNGVVQGATGANAASASPPVMKMARDPICGTYVIPGKALELARGRETLFFCSEACRNRYSEKKPR